MSGISSSSMLTTFREGVQNRSIKVGVIGLGYVGLPLAVELAEAGYSVLGYDVSQGVVDGINGGTSHIGDVPSETLAKLVEAGLIEATTDESRLGECKALSICVPTPLNKIKDPDLAYVLRAGETIRRVIQPGTLDLRLEKICSSASHPSV